MDILIRTERPDDPEEMAAIAAVHAAAFGRPGYGALPAALRATPHHRPGWCFVAADGDGAVVGHVMVGTVFLEDGAGGRVEIANLTPLAVAPHRQGRGLGGSLVAAAVAAVDADGEPAVVLEGSPSFYGRLGFEDARGHGVTFTLPEWAPPEAGQLRPLSHNRPRTGRVVYPPAVLAAFEAAERPER